MVINSGLNSNGIIKNYALITIKHSSGMDSNGIIKLYSYATSSPKPKNTAVLNYPSLWVNIVLACVTFLVFLTALFQERIKKYFNRSVLDMKINLAPPDCHQIDLTHEVQITDILKQTYTEKSIYIRIKVEHKKGLAGENVEIMPINFWRVNNINELSKLEHFLPISLLWSHFRKPTIRVPVDLFRHCDFGHFVNREDKPLLILDTQVQPNAVANNEVPNQIKPGKYQFELLLSGDNVKAIRKKWEIDFFEWSNEENIMLNKYITIKEL